MHTHEQKYKQTHTCTHMNTISKHTHAHSWTKINKQTHTWTKI